MAAAWRERGTVRVQSGGLAQRKARLRRSMSGIQPRRLRSVSCTLGSETGAPDAYCRNCSSAQRRLFLARRCERPTVSRC